MKFKKLFSLLLAVTMVIMLLPMTTVSVFAEDSTTTERNITLGTSAIADGDKANNVWEYIYFGTYNNKEIKWRVLSKSGNNGTYTDANGENSDGAMLLLSEYALKDMTFRSDNNASDATGWLSSDTRVWLQETFGTASNFSSEELSAVLQTTKTEQETTLYKRDWGINELNNDTFFLISAKEVSEYLDAGDNAVLKATFSNGNGARWWLRSPYSSSGLNSAGVVRADGTVASDLVVATNNATRPAFNLNLSSALFTSPAKSGKSSFSANIEIGTLADNDGYKLTLHDEKRSGFSAEISRTSNKAFVSYNGASFGTNEYVTAMIVNEIGDVTYYGSLKNITDPTEASGRIEVDFIDKMNSGDKVYILNEQWNGDYKTDYASELKEVTVPPESDAYISFNANGGTGIMNEIILKQGNDYTLPECTFTYEGYVFAG